MSALTTICEGCGLPLVGKRRGTKSHNATCRSRKHRREHKREQAVCPCCGDIVNRLDDRTGWCSSCARLEIAA